MLLDTVSVSIASLARRACTSKKVLGGLKVVNGLHSLWRGIATGLVVLGECLLAEQKMACIKAEGGASGCEQGSIARCMKLGLCKKPATIGQALKKVLRRCSVRSSGG